MKNIKDITLLAFAIIGFYTVISSFTTKPQDNNIYFTGKTVEGNLGTIIYDCFSNRLFFQTHNSQEVLLEEVTAQQMK